MKVVYVFRVGSEWRFAAGSRTGEYEVCLDKEDAKTRAEAHLWSNGGGTLKILDNERPIGEVQISL